MIEVTHEQLHPERITDRVRKDVNGAVVTFLGVTRNVTGGRKVLYLEYEAYRPMADHKLVEVVAGMQRNWQVEHVAIAHRLGRLEIGDISLVIAVAAPHRKTAFAACQYGVDRIKEIVPIWKKEFYNGGQLWVGSQEDFLIEEPSEPVASSS